MLKTHKSDVCANASIDDSFLGDQYILSPSKRAAQRIYSSRNPLSFHEALRTSADSIEALMHSPPLDVENSSSNRNSNNSGSNSSGGDGGVCQSYNNNTVETKVCHEFVSPSLARHQPTLPSHIQEQQQKTLDRVQRLLYQNQQHFANMQSQIDSLRDVLTQLTEDRVRQARQQPLLQSSFEEPQKEQRQQQLTKVEQSERQNVHNAVAATATAAATSDRKADKQTCTINGWQMLLFAAIFILGLARLIDWVLQTVVHFFVVRIEKKAIGSIAANNRNDKNNGK